MKKSLLNNLIFLVTLGCLTSCDVSTQQTVKAANLKLWITENEKIVVEEVVSVWNKSHVKNQQFNIEYTILTEEECVLNFNESYDDNDAPSMMLIDDKDITTLVYKGMIKEVKGEKKTQIINDNSEFSIKGSTFDESLYSYPISSDSGYFLWYNSNVLNEEVISSLEDILSYAQSNNKQVYFDITDGYYLSSFFSSANACGIDSIKYEIIQELDISNVKAGNYQLYIVLADEFNNSSIRGIRFANTNMYDESLQANLLTNIKIN